MVELKFEAPRRNELLSLDKYDTNGKDESITVRSEYPEYPVPCLKVTEGFDFKKAEEVALEWDVKVSKSIPNYIIIPDPAPQMVCDAFVDKYPELEPILVKDSVRCFLRFFKKCAGKGLSWDRTITSQTLTCIVSFNALRCAKVVLEGMAPQFYGIHANPNCINNYGYFALHAAAGMFSVDMIKLLLRHGASPNVRTVGNDIIENLLPLHVAVENTCMHKYLDDNLEENLSRSQNHLDYIYKLIHLLCLPEMKIFLDTIRLLAKNTNNLLKELWNYIEDGKIIQSAVLLLAAQEQIRGGCSSKINGIQVTTVGNESLSLMARQHTTQTKAVRKKAGGGWDPTYTKRCFFPYWRSVLLARFPVKVYPAYASADPRSEPGQRGVFMSIRADKLGLRQRISPVTSNNQPRRCFITAATGAFRLLKVLK
uniref:Uncharacterized protein n=1 Tax=Avena sativa TaxID=4498 RepID=A0ACD5XTD2_AVESA